MSHSFPAFLLIALTNEQRLKALGHAVEKTINSHPEKRRLNIFFQFTFCSKLCSFAIELSHYSPSVYCDETLNLEGIFDDDLNPSSKNWHPAMKYVGQVNRPFSDSQTLWSFVTMRLLWLLKLSEYLMVLIADDMLHLLFSKITQISLHKRKKSADTCTQSFFSW